MSLKTTAFTSDSSEEDGLLRARIDDACQLCEWRSCPRFVGFLDEHRQAVARAVLRERGEQNFCFFGGYDDAERTFLGVFPSYTEPDTAAFPLTSIVFRYRTAAALSHRDFLGTLLSLGLKREKIGDILCNSGQTVVFVSEDLAEYIVESVTKVGGEGVTAETPFTGTLNVERQFNEWQDTVASARLDAVLKTALRTSREEASRRIAAGLVSLNHMPCLSASHAVSEQDVLSVRGGGRFVVEQIGPSTKKGRLFIKIKQYI
ncbi:MAG: hypothetical protein J6Q42_02150 [Clostridia bacterium]|nr:hypothetical protein [Clostridia bacterium]